MVLDFTRGYVFLLLIVTGFSSSASADNFFDMNQVSEHALMLNQLTMRSNTRSSQEYN